MHRPSGTRRTPSWPGPGTRPIPCSSTSSRRTAACSSTSSGRNPGRGAITGGGGSTISPMGAWWLPAIVMQCGSGVGRPCEWRGVGANHRPEVRAEGNATVVCSAQSLASGLGGGSSVFEFSSHRFHFHTTQVRPPYTSLPVQMTSMMKIIFRCDYMLM